MAYEYGVVEEMAHRLARAEGKIEKEKREEKEMVRKGLDLVEVAGTALAFSYANARYASDGELKVVGVPMDLGAGLLLAAAGLMDWAGGYEEDVFMLGLGCIASYGARLGTHMGLSAAQGGATTGPSTTKSAGLFGAMTGGLSVPAFHASRAPSHASGYAAYGYAR